MVATFSLLALAVCAVWLPAIDIGRYRLEPWTLLLVAAMAAGFLTGVLGSAGILAIAVLAALCWLGQNASRQATRALCTAGAAALAIALALHLVPGFNNPIALDRIQVSQGAPVFTQYANFDKAAAGLLLLAFFCRRSTSPREWRAISGTTAVSMAATAGLVMTAALLTGYAAFDPKLPSFAATFLIINLLFTCVSEEAFFRGFLQERILRARPTWHAVAIVVSGLLFGLAHWAGGPLYVALASLAGICYSVAYDRARRIEAAILTHFAVNAVHFLGFTYPRLLT